MNTDKSELIREKVRHGYGAIARESGTGCHTSKAGDASGGSCCGGSPAHTEKLAAQLGYSVEDAEDDAIGN